MPTFNFYIDASLTNELTTLEQAFAEDGSTGAVDRIIYLGSTEQDKVIFDAVNPGTASMQVSVTDTDGVNGQLAADVKLSLSQSALDTATGGAALNIGVQLLSGILQALPIWIRITPSNLAVGNYSDLALAVGPVVERMQ
ncbi:MAG: hypothetical protein LBE24_10710 [Methylobacillus sp.]|jgi:hypothetical protein|nr:hypothetical protein [Methylobacillus sp.]